MTELDKQAISVIVIFAVFLLGNFAGWRWHHEAVHEKETGHTPQGTFLDAIFAVLALTSVISLVYLAVRVIVEIW